MTETCTSEFVTVDGKRIYVIEKPGDLTPIVFVHGRCLSTRMWERQFNSEPLAGHRLIAFDLPGHGQSDHSPDPLYDYSLFGYRDILLKLLSVKKVDQFLLVGHSFGGYVVLETLPYLTGCLGMLVMTNPLVKPIQLERLFNSQALTVLNEVYTENPTHQVLEQYTRLLLRPEQGNVPAFISEDFAKTDYNVHNAILNGIVEGAYEDEINFIEENNVPVLIVYGDQDLVTNNVYLQKLTTSSWRGSTRLINEAGHLMPWENADAFNNLLLEYVG